MNDPTDTLPTSPTVPGPPPTRIELPDTAPATFNDFRAGTLAASAGSLAADYQRLAEELIDRIVASETAEGRRA